MENEKIPANRGVSDGFVVIIALADVWKTRKSAYPRILAVFPLRRGAQLAIPNTGGPGSGSIRRSNSRGKDCFLFRMNSEQVLRNDLRFFFHIDPFSDVLSQKRLPHPTSLQVF